MAGTTIRSATEEETRRLEDFARPTEAGRPRRTLGLFVALPAAAATLVLSNALPVPVPVRLLAAVAAGVVAFRLWERGATARRREALRPPPDLQAALEKDLAGGRVAVARYDLAAVVKVLPDPRRQVATVWFAKRTDGAVLLLVRPELEEAEAAGDFPAAAFEIAEGEESGLVVSLRRVGASLAPAVVREPLSDGEWEELGDGTDEEVPIPWEEVLERARCRRARGAAARREDGPGEARRAAPPSVDGPIGPR